MKFGVLVAHVGAARPCSALSKEPGGHPEPKPGWFSTQEAARVLGLRPRSARMLLHRAGVQSEWVRRDGLCACLYWEGQGVRACQRRCDRAGDLLECVPEGWMLAHEARAWLGCSKSTLSRMGRDGGLSVFFVRLRCSNGIRRVGLFSRQEVERLNERLVAATREKMLRLMKAI